MIKEYEYHQACLLLPKMDSEEFNALRDSIRKGYDRQHPITLFEEKILDGRHRFEACKAEGVIPFFVTRGDVDPFDFVRREHEGRRSWKSSEQKALVVGALLSSSKEFQTQQRRIREEANRARSEAATGNQNAVKEKTVCPHIEGTLFPNADNSLEKPQYQKSPSATAKATLIGVSRPAIERAETIMRKAPDLAEKVMSGEMAASAALREIKRQEIVAKLEDTAAKEVKALDGVYDVIVIDPPWPMQKIERDVRPNQTEFDYPTMSEAELAAMTMPAADDCHLWLWTTHKFLPMAFRCLDYWEFNYVCMFVWHKPGGFQPIGLPQYNCEFAIYARRGTPSFIDTKAFPVCFQAPRGGHSEKPEDFYGIIRRVTAGRRIDMFNRRQIDGFDTWGKEAQ